MSKASVMVKQYEKDYAQRAPSQLGRTVFTPGKLHTNSREGEVKKDYHVPVGNPNIEGDLADNYYHGFYIDYAIPVTSTVTTPEPVILKTNTEVIQEAGIEGTYVYKNMENIDIHKYEKSTGGFFFDSPIEVE